MRNSSLIGLIFAFAGNIQAQFNAAEMKPPMPVTDLAQKRLWEFRRRQSHKSQITRSQRKARKSRRQAFAAGDRRAFKR
jgi:hypothetical protein